jgi:elongation factor Ts
MSYKLEDVKTLRELMGAGIKDCKDALTESNGDMEQAKKILRERGIAKAEKKSSREATEGAVVFHVSEDGKSFAALEVNCETDFVARSEPFNVFIKDVAQAALAHNVSDVDTLAKTAMKGYASVEDGRAATVLQVGENIQIKRVVTMQAQSGYFAGYQHGQSIAVVVETSKENAEVAKNVAMHIAAINPVSISEADIPAEVLAEEKSIYMAQLKDSDKPEAILEKIVDGKLKKFASGLCLYGQAYVKDPKQTVKEYLKESDEIEVLQFVRYALGE